jgi:hypothetical protein
MASQNKPRLSFAEAVGLVESPNMQPSRNLRKFIDLSKSCIPENHWNALYARTKVAAKRKGRDCTLTLGAFLRLVVNSKDRCAVTGLQFSLATVCGSKRRPFAPSLDRIDCAKGYVDGNVRIVCVSANVSISDWGEGVLYELAKAIVAKYSDSVPPPLMIDESWKLNAPKNYPPNADMEKMREAVMKLNYPVKR